VINTMVMMPTDMTVMKVMMKKVIMVIMAMM
jgi:hypothetical protein